MTYENEYWNYKSVRDPLYGFIQLSRRETLLIGSQFMHRLTRIKQLAHSYLVYPSAVHTRFEHSLGMMHLANRMCDAYKITDRRKEVIRAAALLHDIGHGPFSHLFEDIMRRYNRGGKKFSHEEISISIVKNNPEIRGILRGRDQSEPKVSDIHADVLALFEDRPADTLGRSIISSSLDGDKMDYLRRDSYHTGTTYGFFDLERILITLRKVKDPEDKKEYPAVLEKGAPALESFRLARYLLYTQVYQHHTRLIADRMLLRALELAINEKILPKSIFVFRGREKQFLAQYLKMDDNSLYNMIISSPNAKSASLALEIMTDLKDRRLFKRCYSKDQKDMHTAKAMELWQDDNKSKLEALELEIARKLKIRPEYIIAYGESEVDALKAYRGFGSATQAGDIPMLYIDDRGKSRPYEDLSPIRIRQEPTMTFYVFTKIDHRKKAKPFCERMLDK